MSSIRRMWTGETWNNTLTTNPHFVLDAEDRATFAQFTRSQLQQLADVSGTAPNLLSALADALERDGYDSVGDAPADWLGENNARAA